MFNTDDGRLWLNRQTIVISSVSCLIMLMVLLRTLCYTKTPFVIRVSSLAALGFALALVDAVSWISYGPKFPVKEKASMIIFCAIDTAAM